MTATVKTFFKRFPTDDACLEHLFAVRFGQGHECPKCQRSANWYRIAGRPVFSCQWCGHHIHPMAGTLFEDSHTSLQSWFYAIYLFTTTRHGVSGKELQRQLGVTYKTAWRMGHQIRKHMAKVNGNGQLSGIVEIDEVMVGGKGGMKTRRNGKTLLLGMVERGGRVVAKAVTDTRNQTLHPVIEQNVTKGSEIHTDMWHGYKSLKQAGYTHKAVKHSSGTYVQNGVHVNTLEGYWSHLQRAIISTYVFVSGKYLEQYAAEFSFRFNLRKSPSLMFPALVSAFLPLK
jgi:transposase-like protein